MAQQPNNIGKLCSDPIFISMMYNIVKYSIEYGTEHGIENVKIPFNTVTVIGGAAFMLYAYEINQRNINTMYDSLLEHHVPLTTDIDIAVWYDNIIYDFGETNQKLEVFLRELLKNEQLIKSLQERITLHFGEIQSCRAYVLPARTHRNMTTTIKIHIVINDRDFHVADIAIKNPIYSQPLLNERQRFTKSVLENATYTNKDNTMLLRINERDVVRVPTHKKFIEQQELAHDQVTLRTPKNLMKYISRINYLLKHTHPYAKGGRTKKNKRSKRSKTRRSIR
jgi:hypothetical protein